MAGKKGTKKKHEGKRSASKGGKKAKPGKEGQASVDEKSDDILNRSIIPPSLLPFLKNKFDDSDGAEGSSAEETPRIERLMSMRQPHQMALELTESLTALRLRLADLEVERLNYETMSGGGSQARRAYDREAVLELEVRKTVKLLRHITKLSKIIDTLIRLREVTHSSTVTAMLREIDELRAKVAENDAKIRECSINRISMLQRYWLWRTLQELGDMTVGRTFADELARGPRYRSIGIQNTIFSDTLEEQLLWLQRFVEKEKTFRDHVQRLENFVEEFTDMNDALEEALTCRLCGLLFEDPVIFWPCGHSFCLVCFDSLSVAPSLFRCSTCGSLGSEGYVHNLLLSESVAKWMFKDAGYADVHGALSLIRLHLSKFQRNVISSRIDDLEERLAGEREKEERPDSLGDMDVVYRLY
ncbi:hypothetical protein TRVL_00292 [Trypanosoma vivax]|nr:hypothetical protein TRVL_00292 [Trypanosoma vivax]